jgi:nitrogen fixation protein NifZ
VVANCADIKLQDSSIANRSGKDANEAKFALGQKVKLLTDIVNDGTYPHLPIGALMMPKGSVGYIKQVGEFLQVIRVYEVHFMSIESEIEVVGCREFELEAMEEMCDTQQESVLFKKMINLRKGE